MQWPNDWTQTPITTICLCMAQAQHTHFGNETVTREEKTRRVRGVFDSVASRYDVMNDVMSGGLHRLWKRSFISSLPIQPRHHILDLAGGTGDIAFGMRERFGCHVTICDINSEMLKEGQKRATNRNLMMFDWLCGNAESLPLPSNHFDGVTIAFGIRNVTDIPAALSEARRVLKPGGFFACLEFSHVNHPVLAKAYEEYSHRLIPRMGELIAKDRDSYQYLVESIRKFPPQQEFASMIRHAGFQQVSFRNMTQGVVAIHKGWKI